MPHQRDVREVRILGEYEAMRDRRGMRRDTGARGRRPLEVRSVYIQLPEDDRRVGRSSCSPATWGTHVVRGRAKKAWFAEQLNLGFVE